jgi:hypothetical protein
MKKQFYLFSIALVLSLFMSVSAKADSNSNSNNDGGIIQQTLDLLGLGGSNSNSNPPANQGGTQLPINNGVVFLTIAGIAIGIVTLKRAKAVSTAFRGE